MNITNIILLAQILLAIPNLAVEIQQNQADYVKYYSEVMANTTGVFLFWSDNEHKRIWSIIEALKMNPNIIELQMNNNTISVRGIKKYRQFS
jgi:hypothetical protein